MTETITGTDRSAGISYSELLADDTGPVDEILRRESRVGLREGNTRVPAWYYTSPEFHALAVFPDKGRRIDECRTVSGLADRADRVGVEIQPRRAVRIGEAAHGAIDHTLEFLFVVGNLAQLIGRRQGG